MKDKRKNKQTKRHIQKRIESRWKNNPNWFSNKDFFNGEEWKEKNREHLIGEKNPFYGKTHTNETKELLSKIHKKNWILGKEKINSSQFVKGIKMSKKIVRKMKEYHNKPEIKKIFEERRRKIILPKKDTLIEVKIQNFLKQLGISFLTHQYIKNIEHGYQCDILIPSMNLVIECDGNYWHKYPIGNELDHIRTKELISKGFKVLRLWESEIKVMELNKFIEKIKNG